MSVKTQLQDEIKKDPVTESLGSGVRKRDTSEFKDSLANYLRQQEEARAQQQKVADAKNDIKLSIGQVKNNKQDALVNDIVDDKVDKNTARKTYNTQKENEIVANGYSDEYKQFIEQRANEENISKKAYTEYLQRRQKADEAINDAIEKAKYDESDVISVSLSNGTQVSLKEYQDYYAQASKKLTDIHEALTILNNKYAKGGVGDDTYKLQYDQLMNRYIETVEEAKSWDITGADWADFEGQIADYEQQIKSLEEQAEMAKNAGDDETYTALLGQVGELQMKKNVAQEKATDQEAFLQARNYDYLKENGTLEEINSYAEFLSTRNEMLVSRLAQIGLAGVISVANSPFNVVDLCAEVIDRIDGVDNFNPNDPNLISSKLTNIRNQLTTYALNGTTGVGRYMLESINSLAPFVATLLITKGLNLATGAGWAEQTMNRIGIGVQGVQVGAETAKNDLANNYDIETALLHGALTGGVSALTESIGGEKFASIFTGDVAKIFAGEALIKQITLGEAARVIMSAGLAEGAEEVMEDVLDRFANYFTNIMTGSNFETMPEDMTAYIGDLENSFLMAFVGSVLLSGFQTTPGIIQNNNQYKYAQSMVEKLQTGIQLDEARLNSGTETEEAIQSINKEINNSKIAIESLQRAMGTYEESSLLAKSVTPQTNEVTVTAEEDISAVIKAMSPDLNTVIDASNEIAKNLISAQILMNKALERRGVNVKGGADEYVRYSPEAKQNVDTFVEMAEEKKIPIGNIVFDSSISGNAEINTETMEISINPYAGIKEVSQFLTQYSTEVENKAISQLAHETIHAIRTNSESDYKAIMNEVRTVFGEKYGLSAWAKRVQATMFRYQQAGQDLTMSQAEDEVVAEMVENPSIAGNFDFFEKAVKYSNNHLFSLFQDISNMGNSANIKAIKYQYMKAYKNLFKSGFTGTIGDNSFTETDNRMSLGQYRSGGRDVLLARLQTMSQQDGGQLNGNGLTENYQDLIDRLDFIYETVNKFTETGELPHFEHWSSIENVETMLETKVDENGKEYRELKWTCVVNNGDYELNIDFSTICKKRKSMDKVLNYLCERGFFESGLNGKGTITTKVDMATLRDLIKQHGLEVNCSCCFVDTKRYNVASWSKTFATTYNDIVGEIYDAAVQEEMRNGLNREIYVKEYRYLPENVVKNATTKMVMAQNEIQANRGAIPLDEYQFKPETIEALREQFSTGKWLTKAGNLNAKGKVAMDLLSKPHLLQYVDANDMMASDGNETIRKTNQDLFDLINRHQGSAKPKIPFAEVTYNNEIITSAEFSPLAAFAVGGIRVQSFSDYMSNMVFDYMQMVAEMEAKSLPVHSYTKVEEYAITYGKTGIKINLSLLGSSRTITSARLDALGITGDKARTSFKKKYAGMGVMSIAEYESLSNVEKAQMILNTTEAISEERANEVIEMYRLEKSRDGKYYTYYAFEDESFDFERAVKIQDIEGYDKNVGTICVGVSEEHIWKLLADPNIKMVIPYHKSGISADLAKQMGIDMYNDSTNVQNTKYGNTTKATKVAKSREFSFYEGADIKSEDGKTVIKHFEGLLENTEKYEADNSFEPVKGTIYNYLKYCSESLFIPKFSAFAYINAGEGKGDWVKDGKVYKEVGEGNGNLIINDNYYKLLEDFRLYDRNGELALQKAVKFNIPSVMPIGEDGSILSNDEYTVQNKGMSFSNYLQKNLQESEAAESLQDDQVIPIAEEFMEKVSNKNVRKSIDEDVGYHYGAQELDTNIKSERLRTRQGRGTGAFGTGTYFFGKDAINTYESSGYSNNKNKTEHKVDFSQYNLFKPKTSNEGFELHDFFKALDNNYNYDGYKSEMAWKKAHRDLTNKINQVLDNGGVIEANDIPSIISELKKLNAMGTLVDRWVLDAINNGQVDYNSNGIYYWDRNANDVHYLTNEELSKGIDTGLFAENLEEIADDWSSMEWASDFEERISNKTQKIAGILGISNWDLRRTIEKAMGSANEDMKNGRGDTDSVGTRVMKALGYEGIDVRGLQGLDNSQYGSVIYDLKKSSVRYSVNENNTQTGTRLSNLIDKTYGSNNNPTVYYNSDGDFTVMKKSKSLSYFYKGRLNNEHVNNTFGETDVKMFDFTNDNTMYKIDTSSLADIKKTSKETNTKTVEIDTGIKYDYVEGLHTMDKTYSLIVKPRLLSQAINTIGKDSTIYFDDNVNNPNNKTAYLYIVDENGNYAKLLANISQDYHREIRKGMLNNVENPITEAEFVGVKDSVKQEKFTTEQKTNIIENSDAGFQEAAEEIFDYLNDPKAKGVKYKTIRETIYPRGERTFSPNAKTEYKPGDRRYVPIVDNDELIGYKTQVYDANKRRFVDLDSNYVPKTGYDSQLTNELLDKIDSLDENERSTAQASDKKIAQIVKWEPNKTTLKQRITQEFQKYKRVIDKINNSFMDKGVGVDAFARKANNKRITYLYDGLQNLDNRVSYMLNNAMTNLNDGKKTGECLGDIYKDVKKAGLETEFNEYLYHLRNVDTMSYEARYPEFIDVGNDIDGHQWIENPEHRKNKPVFDMSVTSEESQRKADAIAQAHPEVVQLAERCYTIMSQLRGMLVESGVISQQQADLMEQLQPHYFPLERQVNTDVEEQRKLNSNKAVKTMKGSNIDFYSFEHAGAKYLRNVVRSCLQNQLFNEIGDYIGNLNEEVDENEMAEYFEEMYGDDYEDELQKYTAEGNNLLFDQDTKTAKMIYYQNGQRQIADIDEALYDSLKPRSEWGRKEHKLLKSINDMRRGMITEYNPLFMFTNAIRDFMDAMNQTKNNMLVVKRVYDENGKKNVKIQKQASFLEMYPQAYVGILTNNEAWECYKAMGGEAASYFEKVVENWQINDDQAKLQNIKEKLSFVAKMNDVVEAAPRFAEYLATVKNGGTIEQAMYNAAEITTNFKRGGDITKYMNKHGFTFLNASVQGFMKQIRNLQDSAEGGQEAGVTAVGGLLFYMAKMVLVNGVPIALLNGMLHGDDDDYEDLSEYNKQNYLILGKTSDGNRFWRVPLGRTTAFFNQIFRDGEAVFEGEENVFEALGNMAVSFIDNLAPNNPLDNNILAPAIQAYNNKSWYGGDIVPSRLQNEPVEEQYDETTSSLAIWLGQQLGVSPYKVNYALDQYSGVVGDYVLPQTTLKAENTMNDGTFAGRLKSALLSPAADKFTVDPVMKNQNPTDFYNLKTELNANANSSNATDTDVLKNKYINSVSKDLSDLYSEKRDIQMDDSLNDNEKYEQVRNIQKKINRLADETMDYLDTVEVNGDYAVMGADGNKLYYKDEDGDWKKQSNTSATYDLYGVLNKNMDGMKALEKAKDILHIESLKDSNGKTVKYSQATQVRKELEDAGVYESVLKLIDEGTKPERFNLNNTVIGWDDSTFKKYYNSIMNGNYTTTSSNNTSNTGKNTDTKTPTTTTKKPTSGTGGNKNKKVTPVTFNEQEQKVLTYIRNIAAKDNSKKSIQSTISSILTKLKKSSDDVASNIAKLTKKRKSL